MIAGIPEKEGGLCLYANSAALKPDHLPQPPSLFHPTDLDLLVTENRSTLTQIIRYRSPQSLATLSGCHSDFNGPFLDIETFTGSLENFTGRAHDTAAILSAPSLLQFAFTERAHERSFQVCWCCKPVTQVRVSESATRLGRAVCLPSAHQKGVVLRTAVLASTFFETFVLWNRVC